MARKLACLFYRLIKHGQQYVDKGTEYYEARYRGQQIRAPTRRAQKLLHVALAPGQVLRPQSCKGRDDFRSTSFHHGNAETRRRTNKVKPGKPQRWLRPQRGKRRAIALRRRFRQGL
jgi:hypothetical protein